MNISHDKVRSRILKPFQGRQSTPSANDQEITIVLGIQKLLDLTNQSLTEEHRSFFNQVCLKLSISKSLSKKYTSNWNKTPSQNLNSQEYLLVSFVLLNAAETLTFFTDSEQSRGYRLKLLNAALLALDPINQDPPVKTQLLLLIQECMDKCLLKPFP